MSYVPLENLLNDGKSLYKLTILAARRALALSEGAPRLVPNPGKKKVSTIALEELQNNKVHYEVQGEKHAESKEPLAKEA